jgi:hypothetical protein
MRPFSNPSAPALDLAAVGVPPLSIGTHPRALLVTPRGDNKSTIEHVGMFLAQMGEWSNVKVMNVYFFPMSPTGTTFAWLTTFAQM